MSISIWHEREAPRRSTPDAVVVGGGIAGAYAAYCLGRRGLSVTLLEARRLAACASGRNAGFVLTGTAEHYADAVRRYGRERAREVWQASLANRDRLLEAADGLGVPLRRCGSLLACVDDGEAARARASARLLAEDGFEGVFHDADPLGRGFTAALAKPGDGAVDPARLVRAIAGASGAEVLEGCEVGSISATAGEVVVRARGLLAHTRTVVVAAGPYTPQLLPALVGRVLPVRGQVLATAPGPAVLDTLVYANDGYEYVRQLPDGRLLAGGGRWADIAGERGFDDRVTPVVQGAVEAFVARHFPELAAAPIQTRWSGTMEFTDDLLPLVGPVPGLPGVHVCAGFSGHGLAFALEAAARAVAGALDGEGAGVFDVGRLGG